MTTTVRPVLHLVPGQAASDGAGVRLHRVIGQARLDHLDPFLLLDEFRSDTPEDYLAGFPEHPHRGFETVTYMLAGRMRHRDSTGREGVLGPGSVQWMTAGRGIRHSEMPEQENGLMWGFQLWVNLPAASKMTDPVYQEFGPQEVPVVDDHGVRVRVVAGDYRGTLGPVQAPATQAVYLDVTLAPGVNWAATVPASHQVAVYPFEGNGRVDGRDVARGTLAVLGAGDQVQVHAGNDGMRLLVLAGQPLREPVVRHGPVVMNTVAEVHQAFQDMASGRL